MQSATWKVGLLVVVFAGLAYGVYVLLGARLTGENVYRVYADFENIGGLTKGAKVMMAGVDVGTVEAIELVSAHRARATLAIRRGVRIPEGTTARLPGAMFLPADQKVDLIPPTEIVGFLEPGQVLMGTLGETLESILPEGRRTLVAVQEAIKALQAVVEDQEYQLRLKSILANADLTSAQIALLSRRLNRFAAENEAILNRIIRDAASATADVKVAVAAATDFISDPQWKSRAESLLDSLQTTADRTQRLVTSVDELVSDRELQENIRSTAKNVDSITQSGVEMAATGKEIAANVKAFSEKANVLADDASEIAAEAKILLNRLNEIVQGVPTIRPPRFGEPQTRIDFLRDTGLSRFRTDILVDYPLTSTTRVFGGLYDATEDNSITLQYGTRHSPWLSSRYGLYASKPGVGVDLALSPRMWLEADAFDPNDLSFNVRARFGFGSNWGGFFGVDRIFEDNSLILGMSVWR